MRAAGRYTVVLEPPAVATLIEYLSYCGMGAKQVIEGESFLAGKHRSEGRGAGDDGGRRRAGIEGSVGIGFDFEGVPKTACCRHRSGRRDRTGHGLGEPRASSGVEPTGH